MDPKKHTFQFMQAKFCAMCLVAFLSVNGAGFVVAQNVPVIPVNLELSLVVDTSGSIINAEFDLQMDGYANGFRSLKSEIASFPNGMAVNLILFDSSAIEAIPWTLLTTEAEVCAFADLLDNFVRLSGGGTNIALGLNLANSIVTNEFDGDVLIVDVSGDGRGVGDPGPARDALLAAGVDRINGLPILDGDASLEDFYRDNVIGGADAFVIPASDFASFEVAIESKLRQEILGSFPECTFESDNILCDLDETGQPTGDFVVTGLFTNLQDIPGTHLLLPPNSATPDGVTRCFGSGQQVLVLDQPVNNGESFEVGADPSNSNAIIIKNAMPGDEVCVRLVLLGDNGVECCTVEVCFEMPPCDCLQVDRRLDQIVSNADGTVDYTFQLTNLFGQDVFHAFLAPNGTETLSPDYFDLVAANGGTPLGQGQSVMLTTTVSGAQPEELVSFLITLHLEDFSECCSRDHDVLSPGAFVNGLPENPGPLPENPGPLPGDFSGDGVVDLNDIDLLSANLGQPASANLQFDLNGDGAIDQADLTFLVENFAQTSNGLTGAVMGDINLDGTVSVLGDAFTLVGNLNSAEPCVYSDGDLDGDQAVTVLGDAFTLVGNLGTSNLPTENALVSSEASE